jgi:hypothetical protein
MRRTIQRRASPSCSPGGDEAKLGFKVHPYMLRHAYGYAARSTRPRRAGAGAICGHKGATLHHSGWGGVDVGFLPFPVHQVGPKK